VAFFIEKFPVIKLHHLLQIYHMLVTVRMIFVKRCELQFFWWNSEGSSCEKKMELACRLGLYCSFCQAKRTIKDIYFLIKPYFINKKRYAKY
jgi:hypothetical protein